MRKFTKQQKQLAFECGVKAFEKGVKCAPALDKEFLETYIEGLQLGEGLPLYKQWSKGWNQANLSAPY